MRKSVMPAIVMLFLFVLSSCGGGGGSDVLPPPPGGDGTIGEGEGTTSNPVDLGTVGQPVSHAGSISSLGTSYYTFTTDAGGGKYRLSLKNTNSELMLRVYSNADWSGQVLSCDNIFTGGDIVCVTSSPFDLAPNTDYFIEVSEWDLSADTYTLGISRVDSEGTTADPILLTVGTVHSGSIDAVSSSYYQFQTPSAGEYRISVANLPGMGSEWLSIKIYATDFTAPNLVKSCSAAYNPVCTVNGLAENTFYFVQVTQSGAYDALYTIVVEKGSSEGSIAVPVELTYGEDYVGAVSGKGTSYYTFSPTNTGNSIITLTTTSSLTVTVYSDPAFSSGQMRLCHLTAGGVCTVSSVNQGQYYYLSVSNSGTAAATYTINPSAGSNEGSLSQPVALTLGQTHSGTVDGNGTSYFTFTTAESGSYIITLNTALTSTYWSLYLDQNFTQPINSMYTDIYNNTVITNQCSNTCTTYYYQDAGKTYYNLDANTTYYLTVRNDSAVSGTFTLDEATGTGNSEGSINDPVVLTEGNEWSGGRVAAHMSSYYTFTPSQSENYLIRLTNIQDTTSTGGMTVRLYSDAGFVASLGTCSSRSYYTAYNGDVICSLNSFSSLPALTAGTPYYIEVENNEFYTPNTYSISVSPYALSLGCNAGGATCYNFESGIPVEIDPNPTTPRASDSAWELNSSSAGMGTWSFKSSKPNGNPSSYWSCFAFSAASVKWIGYSMQITTTGNDAFYLNVYDANGVGLSGASLVYGNTAWQRKVYIPPQNAYTYEWCYRKTSTATGDASWVDDIELN